MLRFELGHGFEFLLGALIYDDSLLLYLALRYQVNQDLILWRSLPPRVVLDFRI